MTTTTITTHPCPDCGAVFAVPTPHCPDCGRHGAQHECYPGDAARKARARAFLKQDLKKGWRWSMLEYDYKETT